MSIKTPHLKNDQYMHSNVEFQPRSTSNKIDMSKYRKKEVFNNEKPLNDNIDENSLSLVGAMLTIKEPSQNIRSANKSSRRMTNVK